MKRIRRRSFAGVKELKHGEITTLPRRVTSFWREIERHGGLLDAASDEDATPASQPKELSPGKLAEKLTLLSKSQNANSGSHRLIHAGYQKGD